MNRIAAIVVTFNRLELLKEVIAGLRAQTYSDLDIIVVNNGSTDGTEKWLAGNPDVHTINQRNVGGAGGFYSGLEYAARESYEEAWIMDDDAIPYATALEELMKRRPHSKGFLCSKVIDINSEVCNVPQLDMTKLGNGELRWLEKGEYGMIRVVSATFVSVLIPVSLMYDIGLPYKEFFIWGDDIEYTTRISETVACYLVPTSIVVHKRKLNGILSLRKETNPNRIRHFFYAYRNGLYTARKKSLRKYLFVLGKTCAIFLDLLFHLKLRKSWIILRSIGASVIFNPSIMYPEKMVHKKC